MQENSLIPRIICTEKMVRMSAIALTCKCYPSILHSMFSRKLAELSKDCLSNLTICNTFLQIAVESNIVPKRFDAFFQKNVAKKILFWQLSLAWRTEMCGLWFQPSLRLSSRMYFSLLNCVTVCKFRKLHFNLHHFCALKWLWFVLLCFPCMGKRGFVEK